MENDKTASPLEIQIMLACYCSTTPEKNVVDLIWNSPAAQSARMGMMRDGLIDATCCATLKGKAWAAAICATPMPIQRWITPARPERRFDDVDSEIHWLKVQR